ncbi:MAG TPA: hypothetical protein PKA64_21220 [Myxococcota bacterium]|nr:hypothetical protein [Myxococcota bacterium]
MSELPPLPNRWRLGHLLVITTLSAQQLYAGWQVFVVLQPPGTVGPILSAARTLPPDVMMARRLYAIEGWIALVGLALYLAITEILPRRLRTS